MKPENIILILVGLYLLMTGKAQASAPAPSGGGSKSTGGSTGGGGSFGGGGASGSWFASNVTSTDSLLPVQNAPGLSQDIPSTTDIPEALGFQIPEAATAVSTQPVIASPAIVSSPLMAPAPAPVIMPSAEPSQLAPATLIPTPIKTSNPFSVAPPDVIEPLPVIPLLATDDSYSPVPTSMKQYLGGSGGVGFLGVPAAEM